MAKRTQENEKFYDFSGLVCFASIQFLHDNSRAMKIFVVVVSENIYLT